MGISSGQTSSSFNGKVLVDDANDRILIYDSNNNPIGLFGKDNSGNIVVKVAKAGQNVLTAPNNELIFNSAQDTFKIVKKDSVSITSNPGHNVSVTYQHNLGFVPSFIGFITDTASYGQPVYYQFPYFGYQFNGTSFTVETIADIAYVDDSIIIFEWSQVSGIGAATTYSIVFYLLQETAN